MSCYFEIRASQKFDVFPGGYFAAALMADQAVLPETAGRDEFDFPATLLPGKRVAGFGRRRTYPPPSSRLDGQSPEAAPSLPFPWEKSRDLSFRIITNVLLDQGLIARHLTLRVAAHDAPVRDIPLSSPDVRIDWPCRGTFVVDVGAI
ncbi:MAG: hypothetical protein P4N41_06805 [Negativicutes bacterium]|nr:hypothetical protein [Negativicutes bacterium]